MQLKPADILTHLTAALVTILKQVPGVGMVIEYKDRLEAARQAQQIFNKIDDVAQRMTALEGLGGVPAAEVERTVRPQLRGSSEQNAYVLEVVQHITRQVTRKVNSTKHLGAAKLQDDENFYLSLIPEQRPHNYTGQVVPHHPRWIMQELIGSGGFGAVWRAQHETLPEQEAIKFCHEEVQREFLQREVNTLKLVQEKLAQHPNIVRLKDVNLTQAPYWLAFEYVAGGTLLDVMQQRHLAWGEVLQVMTGIVQGVAAAHALDIVHRDLKPANILLTPDGVPKVSDFGLGKVIQQTAATTNLRMGTEIYASPEQKRGQKANLADDVYALGVIFWQLATHTLDGPEYLSHSLPQSRLPAAAQQLLKDCLQPRDDRPANAQVLWQRLQQLPLTLGTEVAMDGLRQQAEQARDATQEVQQQQFAAQLQAQAQQAQKLQQAQAARMQQFTVTPQPPVVPDGKLAQQWSTLQQLVAALSKISATFEQEWQQEPQRIEEKLQQALQKLGPFKSEPRDEEFEYAEEYTERLANEQAQYAAQQQAIKDLWQQTKQENLARIAAAKQTAITENQQAQRQLQAQRYPWQCSQLTGWRYDLDAGQLYCQGVIKQLLPTELLRLNFSITIPRDQGRLYRDYPEKFHISGQLALQAEPLAIVVIEAYLDLTGEGRFPVIATVNIEPDPEAIAFNEAQQVDTEAALEQFMRDYPQALQLPTADKRLKQLCTARKQREQRELQLRQQQAEEQRQREQRELQLRQQQAEEQRQRKRLEWLGAIVWWVIVVASVVAIIVVIGGVAIDGLMQLRQQQEEEARRLISGRYRDNGDGTVTDITTKLMWRRCSEGQIWNGNTCVGKAVPMTWNEAMPKGRQKSWSSFAGYSDWRVPSKEELRALVYCSNGTPPQEAWDSYCSGKNSRNGTDYQRPTIDLGAFPNTPQTWFWSSSPYAYGADHAWVVGFNNGGDNYGNRDSYDPVRLVRAGQ